MTDENNQTTDRTEVVPRRYKLLEEGDVNRVIPVQDYESLTAMIAQELGENEVAIEGLEEGVKVGDALDIWRKMGVSDPSAETLIHKYFQGKALVEQGEPTKLSEIVHSKAQSLEKRLLGVHQSLGLNRYEAEEEIDGTDYVTKADRGNMEIRIFCPHDPKRHNYPTFTVNVGKSTGKVPEKPKPQVKGWNPGWVALAAFPPTNILITGIGGIVAAIDSFDLRPYGVAKDYKEWLHDVYVLPFKYLAYKAKQVMRGVDGVLLDPRVRVNYGRESHSLEDFIGYVVGTVDNDSDQNKELRKAVKNLVPALERDLIQAHDYANDLEV